MDTVTLTSTSWFKVNDKKALHQLLSRCSGGGTIQKYEKGSFVTFACRGVINGIIDEAGYDATIAGMGFDREAALDRFYAALQELIAHGSACIITEISHSGPFWLHAAAVIITQTQVDRIDIRELTQEIARKQLGFPSYSVEYPI